MSQKNETLQAEARELLSLINACKSELNEPPVTLGSAFSDNMDDLLSNSSLVNGVKGAMAIAIANNRAPATALVITAIGGVAIAGSTLLDVGVDALSRRKAKKMLLPYYEELTVKNTMLIKAQQELIVQLMNTSAEEVELRKALQERVERQGRLIARVADSGLLQKGK